MSDKILIVDDEKEIADLVAFYLESEDLKRMSVIRQRTLWKRFRSRSLT